MKPMLASDYNQTKLKYPCLVQPKIDGVRGLNMAGQLTGRSLKPHANRYTTELYSTPVYQGFDGELAAADERDPELCRKTTSALNTIGGNPFTLWHVFDMLTPATEGLLYEDRYSIMVDTVQLLQAGGLAGYLRIVPSVLCHTVEEVLYFDDIWLDEGYEGTIIRNPKGLHKQGRSTVNEGGLLRIKRFVDAEAEVLSIEEGQTNTNTAVINELGLTERSTHQANMVPNGQVGALICKDLTTGETITVGAGRMTHAERLHYFVNPQEILGKIVKYKHFPRGVKDKPRFPTFQSFRAASDMGGE